MHEESWQHNNENISFRRRHENIILCRVTLRSQMLIAKFFWLFSKNAPDKWSVRRFFRVSVCQCHSVIFRKSVPGFALVLYVPVCLHPLYQDQAKSSSPRNSTNFIHVHFHFPSGYCQNLTCSRSGARRLAGCAARGGRARLEVLNCVSRSVLKTNVS